MKVWMKERLLLKYIHRVIWLTGAYEFASSLLLLGKRILDLIKKSGLKFTFIYLKEVLRITVQFLAGNNFGTASPKGLPYIGRGRSNKHLPGIIPCQIRKALMSADLNRDRSMIIALFTVLSVFRTFGFKTLDSLKTIVKPHNGKIKTFSSEELAKAIKSLSVSNFRLKGIKPFIIEKAGPNGNKSTWAASIDAIAYLLHPHEYLCLIKLALFMKNGKYIIAWLMLIQIFFVLILPIYILFYLYVRIKYGKKFEKPDLGKLSVVYDQAGKARIVGITNWWLQIVLNPLHNSLFEILSEIETDGTFNQENPILTLVSRKDLNGSRFFGFDLSAATDRLPIEVQADILNQLQPELGTLWKDALSIQWRTQRGKLVRYAVGQPMGAYSSWAMLALTHHIVVMIAASRVGLHKFNAYAILGDDIVIANEDVANSYLLLMSELGVDINLSKSVISSRFTEFAKKYVGPNDVNISPIGPGLILRSLVNKNYTAAFITEGFKLGLLTTLEDVLIMLLSYPYFKLGQHQWNTMWALLGVNGILKAKSQDQVSLLRDTMSWIFSTPIPESQLLTGLLYNVLRDIDKRALLRASAENLSQYAFFKSNWFKVYVTQDLLTRILEFLLKIVSPGFWLYLLSYFVTQYNVMKAIQDLPKGKSDMDIFLHYSTWDEVYQWIQSSETVNALSIDWSEKEEVIEYTETAKELMLEMTAALSKAHSIPLHKSFFGINVKPQLTNLSLSDMISNIEDNENINSDSVI